MSALLHKALRRRAFLQFLTAVPAFTLFRVPPPAETPQEDADDGVVLVGGWLLKRSDVA